ncbi:outer dynein arm-docking complex subunit 1 [Pantherophis guttatus]|uniref:Coiled-coil domain-containing protein 114 n=1 Tax=Pantherophis guttatus TaxID=94885 RepID=A0A6P9C6Z5_PANGU|nr:outer dynein arm-docking complex subunit 1 [Pantherophis guttatus]XP_034275347.1 outer dynein arm-docking complex subunit 1 [Pantherophis guttatus]
MPFFKSASSFRSESSDGDLEGIAEGELAKLQRQFRLLEGDRHAYALESRETIRRQTVEVKRLEKENEDLRYKQAVAEGHANQKKEKAQSEILRSLLAERDAVKEQIMKEKKRITRLDQEIETWENRLADRKQTMGSDSMIQEQRAHLQRKIQTVENQLDKITSEFSSQLVLNSQLREDLEILRVGHDHFEQQHKDLEEELLETRKTIINVVSTSSAAYDARDEAHARLGQLRDKAEKDLKQYISEMKELERFLENDRRVSEFVNIKLQERTFTEEALRAKAKKQEERRRKDSEEELLESYSNAFDKLLELTGSKDLNMALDTFVKDRERNFAQFNYVNEQNSQKDRLWEEIHELCHEIQEIQKRNSQREAQQLLQLHETEGQQEETVKEANQAEQNVKKFLKIWEQLKSAIESLFWKLECDHSSLEKVLGGTTTAQDENVAIYLSIIERKVNMLLTMYSYKKAEEKDEPYDTVETAQLLLGQTPGLRPTAITVRPPTAGLGHEPIQEEDNRPLTHEELREKVIKEIQSKAAALSLKKST